MDRWVRDFSAPLFHFLRRRIGDAALAEDLLQDVFCRAWEARERYAEQGTERGYLFAIADRLALGWLRGRRPAALEETFDPPGDFPEPWKQLSGREEAAIAAAVIERLPEAQQRTLLLRYYGGMEFKEIAAVMGVPLNTALSHGKRGLDNLRRQMAEGSA
ncbi:MAG TPA: RNA polymerase sigma factor [Planctomycetia bacterium]|nr:RNA polymerase sigma factor [Planctomycetia bacterium]